MPAHGSKTRLLRPGAALAAALMAIALMALTGGRAPAGGRHGGDHHGRGHMPPYETPRLPVRQRVRDLMSRMTLEEKVGQMTQTERAQVYDDATPITTWKLGSILSGGGSVPTPNTPE